VEHFLRNGLQSPHKLLNAFIQELASCLPGDIGKPFAPGEPNLQITVQVLGFEWDKLRSGRFVLQLPIPPSDLRYGRFKRSCRSSGHCAISLA
jgi:hypothetical protein